MRFFQLAIVIISKVYVECLNVSQNVTAPAVFDLMESNSDLSILNSLIDIIPGFRRSISNGNFTFLAPTDTALTAFNESNPKDFLILESDTVLLTDFLQSIYMLC